MSEPTRNCPSCGHSLLGITSAEEIASCPNCGKFYERYRPAASHWPPVWQLALVLCGPMMLVTLMRAGQWFALRADQQALRRFLIEAVYVGLPLAWFAWPIVAAFLLARRFAPGPEQWMSALGLAVAALVSNTAIMLASMLLQVFL